MTLIPCGLIRKRRVRPWLTMAGACLIVVSLASCSLFSSKPDEPNWTFGADGIFLQFKADGNLNLFDKEPHTVAVGLFQMNSPNAFQKLVATPDGASALLAQGTVDKSIIGFERFFIQPGANMTQVFDRLEGAKYIGLVVGYVDLSAPGKISIFKPVPTGEESEGFLFTTGKAEPTLFWLRVGLGSDGIVSVDQLTQADAVKMQKQKGGKGSATDAAPGTW